MKTIGFVVMLVGLARFGFTFTSILGVNDYSDFHYIGFNIKNCEGLKFFCGLII